MNGVLTTVEMTEETVEFSKFETKNFMVRVRKESINVFEEKIANKPDTLRETLKVEFVQRKMRKKPKVVIANDEYEQSMLALKKRIFRE